MSDQETPVRVVTNNPREEYIKRVIEMRLKEIEHKHGVTVIFACEAGSRAWGFPSLNSDYDVRFIYVKPYDDYLSINIENRSDTIQMNDKNHNLDIDGWDLRKALKLFAKCNPSLLEWLNSPIVYRESDLVISQLRKARKEFFNEISGQYHYYHMAWNNYKKYIRDQAIYEMGTEGEIDRIPRGTISYKKYLYVIRPLLAMDWIGMGKGAPPVLFSDLVNFFLPYGAMREALNVLLELKMKGDEKMEGPPIETIQHYLAGRFVAEEDPSVRIGFSDQVGRGDMDTLNSIFRSCVTRTSIKLMPGSVKSSSMKSRGSTTINQLGLFKDH